MQHQAQHAGHDHCAEHGRLARTQPADHPACKHHRRHGAHRRGHQHQRERALAQGVTLFDRWNVHTPHRTENTQQRKQAPGGPNRPADLRGAAMFKAFIHGKPPR